jgi:hypothetical protein
MFFGEHLVVRLCVRKREFFRNALKNYGFAKDNTFYVNAGQEKEAEDKKKGKASEEKKGNKEMRYRERAEQ